MVRTPAFADLLLITDNAILAACLSVACRQASRYFAIIDGPRMAGQNADAEVIRRTNAVARVNPKAVIFGALSEQQRRKLSKKLPNRMIRDLLPGDPLPRVDSDPILCGADRLGKALLKALRENRMIRFIVGPSEHLTLDSISGHVVVCEDGHDLSQVIAANYAYALGASLVVIPKLPGTRRNLLLEQFYSLNEDQSRDPRQTLEALASEMRSHCGDLALPSDASITFISEGVPYGFAFAEAPSTHLPIYPDLGIAVVNGFAAEQVPARLDVVALIDPGTTTAPEIDQAAQILAERGAYVRAYRGGAANVRDVSDTVEYFPYDLMIFATHCGDAAGSRLTYNYPDKEGIARTFVVDEALSVGHENRQGELRVALHYRFHSLDGKKWMDPEHPDTSHVGSAVTEWLDRIQSKTIQPDERVGIPRVLGSAVMRMADHNYMPHPHNLAAGRLPVLINNACVSWHELAGRFMFAGARAYIGTLTEVTDFEAQAVIVELLENHFDEPLAIALWAAQATVYGTVIRRPYVMTGVFTQKFHSSRRGVPNSIRSALSAGLATWRQKSIPGNSSSSPETLQEIVAYYERELSAWSRYEVTLKSTAYDENLGPHQTGTII